MPRFRSTCAVILVSSLAFVVTARASSGGAQSSTAPTLLAQNFQPPGAIPDAGGGYGGPPPAGDSASQLIRIDRLEDQVRTLNGQIEQLQFNQQRLEEALRKFQGDVDFRFQDVEHGKAPARGATGKRSDASEPAPSSEEGASSEDGDSVTPRHEDAFDPAAHPNAPGAPRVLGALPPRGDGPQSIPSPAGGDQGAAGDNGDDAGAPLQLDTGPTPQASDQSPSTPLGGPVGLRGGESASGRTVLAELPPNDPREDFDLALVSFNNGRFDQAQSGFRGFLDRHPRDRLASEAVYYLGESYWRLGRFRDAAEQYLKVSTTYAKSSHAPESLLKLGLSLEKLGSRDQACASWAQIGRKYPTAATPVRASAERNMKRDQC